MQKVEGHGVEARDAKGGLLHGENTLGGIDAKGVTDSRTRVSWESWWYILGLPYCARESMYTVSESD